MKTVTCTCPDGPYAGRHQPECPLRVVTCAKCGAAVETKSPPPKSWLCESCANS